ncbi:MAG: phosphoribosylglycinamide formyltransferase [Paludibacteraceae bacterium]|nr:phosphoribosylglycinamide formyltransferase [Paludibacteraceae bacterium]
MPVNIAIFASGNGSNAENILKHFEGKGDVAKIRVVMCNNAKAYVLERAAKYGVPTVVFSKKEMEESEKVEETLEGYGIDFIVLSGFMLKIPEKMVRKYPNRIVNIHPALLPKYGGKGMYGDHVHEAVLAAGEKESGITIHYANEQYDSGDILFQATCPVEKGDTVETLAQRVHQLEYAHFPSVIEETVEKL